MNEETRFEQPTMEQQNYAAATPTQEAVANSGTPDVMELLKKNLKWIALAVVALILICIIASCASKKDRFTRSADMENAYMSAESDLLVSISGNEITTDEEIYSVNHSSDYSLTVVETREDVLYFVKGNKLVEVDEEVDAYIISAYGDSIAYLKEVENGVGELYLYNVAKEKAEKIDSEAYEEYFVLSPDGKTIAYLGNCEVEVDDWWGYDELTGGDVFVSKNGKKAEKRYKDAIPVAVSNNAKYVYYIEDVQENGKFCVNDKKILADSTKLDEIIFNDDLTEMLYYADGDTRYFTAAKAKDVKVKSSYLYSVMMPENAVVHYIDSDIYMYGIDTFNKSVISLDSGLYYMYDKGEETEKIATSTYNLKMSDDGKSFLFVDGDELVRIKDVTKSREEVVVGEDLEISTLYTSKDLKKIYYIDYDEELFLLKKNGKSVSISDDVTSAIYSDKYDVIYFIEDEELFYATTSAKSKKSVAEDVTDVAGGYDSYVLYYVEEDDEAEVYVMTKKNKSKFLFGE